MPVGPVENTVADSPGVIQKKYGGAVVTMDQRARTLGELGDVIHEQRDKPAAQREQVLVSWLHARPEIEDAGAVHNSSVWARFKDGKMIIVMAPHPRPPAQKGEREGERSSRLAKEMPASKKFALFDTDHLAPAGNRAAIASMTGDGYRWMGEPADIAGLEILVRDVAVFAIDGHGGPGYERRTDEKGDHPHLFAITTSEPVRDANGRPIRSKGGAQRALAMDPQAARFESELSTGQLVYTWGGDYRDPNDGTEYGEARYGITRRFVKAHFTFAKDALVYLNACFTATELATDFVQSFLDKRPAPAVVLGWTGPSSANLTSRATEMLFDRMTGANTKSDYGLSPDKPPQRPWNLQAAWEELKAKGFDQSPWLEGIQAARLVPIPADADLSLVPSIVEMDVDEIHQVLTLHGSFGRDPGAEARSVTIGGAPCPVKQWNLDTITCDLGDDFKTGDVVATSLGRRSNAAPLTGWRVPVQYVMPFPNDVPGDFVFGLGIEAHIRGDVHRHRERPDADPVDRRPFTVFAAHTTKCVTNDRGSFAQNGGYVELAGNDPIPVVYDSPKNHDSGCIVYATIDPGQKKMSLAFMAWSRGGNRLSGSNAGTHGVGFATIPVPGLYDGVMPPPPGAPPQARPFPKLDLAFDENWRTPSGSHGPLTPPDAPAKLKVMLKWQPSHTAGAPNEKTPQ